MEWRLPRTSAGASGLGSNESRCVTPPAIHSTMTERARPFAVAPLLWGKREPATLREATRSKSRRFIKANNCGADMAQIQRRFRVLRPTFIVLYLSP